MSTILSTLSLIAAAAMAAVPFAVSTAKAAEVELNAGLGQSVIVSGAGEKLYLKIGLSGLKPASSIKRSPINVGLVIDRSGSMDGDNKMAKAREAALSALVRLGLDDIASVVAYNHEVQVLLPATRLTSREAINSAIDGLVADGNTALYAGTEQGIAEVGKFFSRDKVNRVILISDGLANVGPETPDELAALGRKAASKGVTVTTIGLGLGYNEDLMTKLAYASDGNHAFVENSDQLVSIFDKEFGDVLSVVAQELVIKIRLEQGFRPIRTLGRESEISGDTVTIRLNQIYGGQEKYVVLELDAAKDIGLGERKVAQVDVSYNGMSSGKLTRIDVPVRARFTVDMAEAEKSVDKKIMTDVTLQLANEINEEAVKLRDVGRIDDAKNLMNRNISVLKKAAEQFDAPALAASAEAVEEDAEKLSDELNWNQTRKALRAKQHKEKVQQSF